MKTLRIKRCGVILPRPHSLRGGRGAGCSSPPLCADRRAWGWPAAEIGPGAYQFSCLHVEWSSPPSGCWRQDWTHPWKYTGRMWQRFHLFQDGHLTSVILIPCPSSSEMEKFYMYVNHTLQGLKSPSSPSVPLQAGLPGLDFQIALERLLRGLGVSPRGNALAWQCKALWPAGRHQCGTITVPYFTFHALSVALCTVCLNPLCVQIHTVAESHL